jgi:hypothetical protein
MPSSGLSTPRLTVAAASLVLLAIGIGSATAAPATDDQGFVDSTARCTTPNVAVVFGNTATSRVAICKTPGGQYEYRGVRVSDGATLIIPATQSGDGQFIAENDGIRYTVTSSSLGVSAGNRVIRDEPMAFFHGPATAQAPKQTPTPAAPPTSTTTTAPTTTTPTTTTPPTPLPPPLPAEVGGSGR